MKAAVLDQVPGPLSIQDVDIDRPQLGEVLVRTVASGLCHSDLHAIHGDRVAMPTPFVLGHEAAGVVEAVGPGVTNVQPGDHVVACLSVYCGHCAHCLTGQAYRCFKDDFARPPGAPGRLRRGDGEMHQFVGISSFAEQMLLSQHNVVRIDPSLPLEQACLLGCGVLTGVGAALRTAGVTPGSTVAVIGCGGVGLSVLQGARLAYARKIVAIDVDEAKLELARRCGATDVVDASEVDAVEALNSVVPGGVDFAFEAIGRPETAQQAIAMTGFGGVMTLVGMAAPDAQFTVSGLDMMLGKTIQQSVMGSNRFGADIPLLAEHALAGRLDLDVMVSETHELDELPSTVDRLEAGHVLGRAVFTF
jgi:S-(hydroxymethyl)glutathione dehydrogenase/alcohol dehydrogenase